MNQPAPSPVPAVEPAEAERLLDDGAFALDVREPDEYAAGHVAGARLIPLGQLAQHLQAIPRDRTTVVICRSGRRSGEAVGLLQAAGLTGSLNLTGGMIAWRRAGLPVEE